MSQPFTFKAANNCNPMRIGQVIFTVLTLVAFALGSLLLSLGWFGVGVTTAKIPGAEGEARAFLFIIVWPLTMLAVWILGTGALLLGKRWLLASLSLPAAFVVLYAVWLFVALSMLTTSAVAFTMVFILLNIGAIRLAARFLRSTAG